MNSHYRWVLSFLLFPMTLGYNPVTDTLRHALDIDVLYGTGDYYSGCESPRQNMMFEEIHVGLRTKAFGDYSIRGDYRLNGRVSVRFGGLAGERRAKSAWMGVRIDLK